MSNVKEYEDYMNLQIFKMLLRDTIKSFPTPANHEYYRRSEVDDWISDLKTIIDVFTVSNKV